MPVQIDERCVIANCSISIPNHAVLYPDGLPTPVRNHCAYQAWEGVSELLQWADEEQPKFVLIHSRGKVLYVLRAQSWWRVVDDRVVFELADLEENHPYLACCGTDISSVTVTLGSHSAFFLD